MHSPAAPLALLLAMLGSAYCQVDLSTRISVGSVESKGTRLSVFEIDGVQFAEPSIQFAQSCGTTTYNHVYQKYQIPVSVLIGVNALQRPLGDNKKLGQVSIHKLLVDTDATLGDKKSNITVQLQQENAGEAQLLFLCDEFERCETLRTELLTNPVRVQRALEFSAVGVVESGSGGLRVRFAGQTSSNPPPVVNCHIGNRWIVFQRRVDGTLSFAQNWDTYVRGFGNPHSNYWMGLNQLFASTASSEHNGHGDTARCQLRVEATDYNENAYWAQFNFFQVMSPDQFYRVRIQGQVIGSNLEQIGNTHEKQFSTYDRHNSGCPGSSCSRHFGYGGWWFPGIFLNANAVYTTDYSVQSPTYLSAIIHGKWVILRNIVMMFRCK